MKLNKFLIKLVVLCIAFIGVYALFINKLSKGTVDIYYNKLNQEAGSLILGLSRADQGISPYIIENDLSSFDFSKPVINFAMNAHQSAFGEVYLKGVMKKIENNNNNGIFIISLNPGNFTVPITTSEENVFSLDKASIIGSINNLTKKPNYDYLISKYESPLYSTFFDKKNWRHLVSHNNGWNEVILISENDTITEADINNWKSQTIDYYKREVEKIRVSNYRMSYFIKTIEFLKTKGSVFLIRMPSDISVLKFAKNNWSDFDHDMDSVSTLYNVPYFNYSSQSNEYKTYDGSHLESESAKKFTKQLCLDIKNYLKTKN